ncbi:hypothetical protein [Microbacterium sp. KNMS]
MSEHITAAFTAIRSAGEALRNAEEQIREIAPALVSPTPRAMRLDAALAYLSDVRTALGAAALELADEHAEHATATRVEIVPAPKSAAEAGEIRGQS